MEMWQVGAAANIIITVAYLAISFAIVRPLVQSGQLRTNRLGAATGAIFLSCGVGHGVHAVHFLLPLIGIDAHLGNSLRANYEWHLALPDLLTSFIGVYYWSLRKTYGGMMRGAALFDDLRERQRQALEINDKVVQGLTVARMAMELDRPDLAGEGIDEAMNSAHSIMRGLLGDQADTVSAGDLVRAAPASLGAPSEQSP